VCQPEGKDAGPMPWRRLNGEKEETIPTDEVTIPREKNSLDGWARSRGMSLGFVSE